MHLIKRSVPLATLLGVLALAPASEAAGPAGLCPSTLNPPPLSFETCQTVGDGTIASGSRVVSYGPLDTGTCGSGASAFEVFDQGTYDQHATRWYDLNGNLTSRKIYDHYTFGQWSNPLVGSTVNYTQESVESDVLAIPGDLSSSTTTSTGEIIIKSSTGAPVLFATGRQVGNIDGSELYSSAGRNDFVALFFEGDSDALDSVCAALAGS
jgi:hypothetical protein